MESEIPPALSSVPPTRSWLVLRALVTRTMSQAAPSLGVYLVYEYIRLKSAKSDYLFFGKMDSESTTLWGGRGLASGAAPPPASDS